MAVFLNLPDELVPCVIQFIVKPQQLSSVSLVNRFFHLTAIPILYERISIFSWHKEAKKKATKVLETLADSPQLARYVKRLEVRDFPKSTLQRLEGRNEEILDIFLRGIRNCLNLQAFVWTRDGTMNSLMVEELSKSPSLDSLEINGHHNYSYDPRLLLNFHGLRHLSIIMPSNEVLKVYPTLLTRNIDSLESLSLICRSSPLVTDDFLNSISPSLHGLRSLSLAGCPKVTHQGVKSVLDITERKLRQLSLEALSPSFDINSFKDYCISSSALQSVEDVTLSIPLEKANESWFSQTEAMLALSPIRKFHVYSTGSRGSSLPIMNLDNSFIRQFLLKHARSLTRLAVLRFPISLKGLKLIVEHGVKLEELFITMKRADFEPSAPVLVSAHTLRSLHITFPAQFTIDEENEDSEGDHWHDMHADPRTSFLTREELIPFAAKLSPSVHQFGVLTRVWRIERNIMTHVDGPTVDLAPYENPDIPGVFLVIRT